MIQISDADPDLWIWICIIKVGSVLVDYIDGNRYRYFKK